MELKLEQRKRLNETEPGHQQSSRGNSLPRNFQRPNYGQDYGISRIDEEVELTGNPGESSNLEEPTRIGHKRFTGILQLEHS